MPTVPNRDSELPEPGREYDPQAGENFGDDLNAVLEEVSANALVSSTDRSNHEPVDGTLFVPADGNGPLYRGTGTEWEPIDPLEDNPTLGDATADSITINNAPVADTDAVRKQELDATNQSAAPFDAEYVTVAASADLPNSQAHADITTDADLHAPKAHDHSGDTLSPSEVQTNTLTTHTTTAVELESDLDAGTAATIQNLPEPTHPNQPARLQDAEGVDDHDHAGDTLVPDEIAIGNQSPDPADYPVEVFSVAGVTFWVGDEVTDAMADTDVFIDVSE